MKRSDFETIEWVALKQVAAHRHLWACEDRFDYAMCVFHRRGAGAQIALTSYLEWSTSTRVLNAKAMALMGLTEEDQFYA